MRTQALHATRTRVGIIATADHLQFRVNKGKKKRKSTVLLLARRSRHCRCARARGRKRAFSHRGLAAGFSPRSPRISRLDERLAVIYGPPRRAVPRLQKLCRYIVHTAACTAAFQRHCIASSASHRDLNINPALSDVRLSFETYRRKCPASYPSEEEIRRNSTRHFCTRLIKTVLLLVTSCVLPASLSRNPRKMCG